MGVPKKPLKFSRQSEINGGKRDCTKLAKKKIIDPGISWTYKTLESVVKTFLVSLNIQ